MFRVHVVNEIQSFEPSETENQAILATISRLLDLSEEQLALLVSNKSRFESLKIGGM
jgi:hypothetical protein